MKGMVRRPRKMPPMPIESAMVCFRPYLLGVDVVQRDRDPPQVGEPEDVCQQVLGELDATGADERYLGHGPPLSVVLSSRLRYGLLHTRAGDSLDKVALEEHEYQQHRDDGEQRHAPPCRSSPYSTGPSSGST